MAPRESVKRLIDFADDVRVWWLAYFVAAWFVMGLSWLGVEGETGDEFLDFLIKGVVICLAPGILATQLLVQLPAFLYALFSWLGGLLLGAVGTGWYYTTPVARVFIFAGLAYLLWTAYPFVERAMVRVAESRIADEILALVGRLWRRQNTEEVTMVRQNKETNEGGSTSEVALLETAKKLQALAPGLPALPQVPGQHHFDWKGWIAAATQRFQMRQMHRSGEVALMLLRQMNEYYAEWLKAHRAYDQILNLDEEREDASLERLRRRKELQLEIAKLDEELGNLKPRKEKKSPPQSPEDSIRQVFHAQLKQNVALEKIRQELLEEYPELRDRTELIYEDLRMQIAEGRSIRR